MMHGGLIVLASLVFYGCSSDGGVGGSGGDPGVGGLPGESGGAPGLTGGAPGTGAGPGAGGVASGGGPDAGGSPSTGGAGGGGAPGSGGGNPGSGGDDNTGPVTVQLDDVRQLIRGFGINNNWAAIGSDADRMFGNGTDALMLNILRVGMGPDGNPYNGNSCYSDINAVVQRANARSEPHYIMATLWSPPANFKTNNSISDGGFLKEENYAEWSDTIAAFPDKIEANTDT